MPVVALAGGVAIALPAAAADVDLFEPAAAFASGRGSPQAEAPHIGDVGWVGGVVAAYAANPVVWRYDDGTKDAQITAQIPLTLHAGYALGDRLRFDALLPTYPWVDAPITGFRGPAGGDVRLQSTIRIAGGERGRVGVAVVPRVGLPTGSDGAAVSRGVSQGLVAAVGADGRRGGFAANAGANAAVRDQLATSDRAIGSAAIAVVGAWWRPVPDLRIGAEIDAQIGLAGLARGRRNDAAATHGFAQLWLPKGIGVGAGAGTGVIAGIGSPEVRVFSAVTVAARVPDTDNDGIGDPTDACPLEAEDVDGVADGDGCPEVDSDGDGILDAIDLCARVPEDRDGFDDDDGCPDADNDGDGVVDDADRCRSAAGPASLLGCPDSDGDDIADLDDRCPEIPGAAAGCPDRDLDRVPDWRDACPDAPSAPGEDPATSDGCPKTVWITPSAVRIRERISFSHGSAVLNGSDFGILDRVAELLEARTDLRLIEIAGHTNAIGSVAYNDRLSRRRAEAVRDYLVSRGIRADRLVAKGYGERAPVDRARELSGGANRCVEFRIRDRE